MFKIKITAVLLCSLPLFALGQTTGTKQAPLNTNSKKMKVEIWSDVVCPFCYIGKRKFEQALEKFPHKDQVEIVWKSFQLDPEAPSEGTDYLKNLSERKGWSLEQTKEITSNVTEMASEVGLTYHFEKAISANSFDAHRLSHYAHTRGLQDAAEEALFKSHFTEGKNIANHDMLTKLGMSIGLDSTEVKQMLDGKAFTTEVQQDIQEASELRISGVPFFVFDRKYAISGAQATEVFMQTLKKAFETWEGAKP
jgi:predicted DsbA family dithiol-disulfide isomerase